MKNFLLYHILIVVVVVGSFLYWRATTPDFEFIPQTTTIYEVEIDYIEREEPLPLLILPPDSADNKEQLLMSSPEPKAIQRVVEHQFIYYIEKENSFLGSVESVISLIGLTINLILGILQLKKKKDSLEKS